VSVERSEGDRNALLAVHFEGEGDPRTVAAARAHASGCPHCRAYLLVLAGVDAALRDWPEEAPPPDLAARVLSRATRSPQYRPVAAAVPSAMPLVGLLPVIAALLLSIRELAVWLDGLAFWASLESWPALQNAAPFAAAVVVLFTLGGLASLAVAPALVMDTRR
jgi:hypothetical protein